MSSNTVYRLIVIFERFLFNKISGLEFRKFHVPNATVHFGCTDPTQATAHLFIVLVSKIQNCCTWDNNFVKWKGTFQSDRPKWPDRSKLFPNIPVGPNEMVSSIWCTNRDFRNFGLNGKRPLFRIPGWKSMGVFRLQNNPSHGLIIPSTSRFREECTCSKHFLSLIPLTDLPCSPWSLFYFSKSKSADF